MDLAVLDLFQSTCTDASESLQKSHPQTKTVGIQCDVTKPDELAAALDTIVLTFPNQRIGAVFANAGVLFPAQGVLKSKIQDWQTTFDVNVLGVVNTLQVFVPAMQQHAGPSVVCTTASIGGLMRCPPNLADYCASKHAVVALTEALSFELVSHPQIRVCVCCPCIVRTGLGESSQANRTNEPGAEVQKVDLSKSDSVWPFAMTPKAHGQQVWDRIAAGEFYMICDNIRPYVDHDFKLDGMGMVEARFAAINRPDFERSIDNGGSPYNHNGSHFTSPMVQEQTRLARAARATKPQLDQKARRSRL
jgi:NAD(P)-dependent dehydrogenase (short-subunit alcohol dehydrogenase family)